MATCTTDDGEIMSSGERVETCPTWKTMEGPHWQSTADCIRAHRRELQGQACALVNGAIRGGRLEPPNYWRCVDCGKRAAIYEHRNYNTPLQVEPACQRCNARRGSALPWTPNVDGARHRWNGHPASLKPREQWVPFVEDGQPPCCHACGQPLPTTEPRA